MTEEIGARLSLKDRRQFSSEAQTAARDVENIGTAATKAEAKSRGPLRSIGSGLMSVGGMALKAGAYAASGLGLMGSAAIGVGIKTAAGMETAEIGFTTMLGSAEKAQAFLADLNEFAAKTPFDLPGLQKSASSLVSAGIEADKVIPIMTSLGNATSGMGTGAEGIQRATVALQQMNAAGKITGEDLNQLRDAGIPVFDLLAAATGKSVKQVAELANQGKLGAKELEQLMGALESGKGLERFNGLMEAQSTTMSGLWSTLKDTFSVGMAEAIQPLVPLIKDGLGRAIEFTAAAMPRIQSGIADLVGWGRLLYGIFFKGDYQGGLVAGLEEDSSVVDKLFTLRENALGLYNILFKGDFTGPLFGWEEDATQVDLLFRLREGVIAIKDALSALVSGDAAGAKDALGGAGGGAMAFASSVGDLASSLPSLSDVLTVAAGVVSFLADNMDTVISLLPWIAAGFLLWKAAMAAKVAVQIASLPLTAAEIAASFALASANRALAFQLGVVTGVQRTTMLSRIGTTAATVAGAVATGALTVATGALTAAQWLLNAAMSLNPFALVVIAIVALIAIFVLAYKKSETFRNIVNGVFSSVKNAAGVAVDWIVEKWRQFTGFFGSIKLPTISWDGIKNGFRSAVNWIIDRWNNLSLGIPAIDTKIPGIGKVGGFTLNTPNIPRLHTGGTVARGGAVNMLPGEEIVILPPAATVVPMSDDVRSMAAQVAGGSSGGGQPIVMQVVLDRKVLAEAVYDHTGDKMARR